MTTSWATLIAGKTQSTILTESIAALQTAGLSTTDWNPGGVVRTILDKAWAGGLSKVWEAIPDIVKGGFLRKAQELAEADLADWNADPTGHWLYLLGTEFFGVAIKPSEFTQGTVRYTNSSATPQTITPAHVVANSSGLRYTPTETKALPAGGTIYVKVKAESPGNAYNVAQATVTTLTVALPGVSVSNVPDPADLTQTSWITTYGSDTESPKQYADRCAARWGRVTKLQALVTDGYKSLALDAHADVKKVAVWQSYSHALAGFKANSVTLYLGSNTGPVAAAVANSVKISISPYIGVHDVLEVQPCGTQTYTITGTVFVQDASLIASVRAAVEAALVAYNGSLDIGQKIYAWKIRDLVGVSGVVNFVETLADFTPNKNALVTINYAALTYQAVT